MDVGKKKVKEELDLTNEGKVEDEKKKADAKFKKDFEKPLSRGTVTQKALPLYKAGGPFIPDKTVDKKTGEKVKPMETKPYMGKATVPVTPKKEPIPADTGAGDPKEVKKTKKTFSDFSKKVQSLRKDIEKSKQDVVDVETDKFFKDLERKKREDVARKAIETGRTGDDEDASKIGTRDYSTMNPSERERAFGSSGSTEGGAGVEGPKNQSGLVPFKQTPAAKKTGEQAAKETQGATSGLDKAASDFASRKRGESGAIPYKELVKQANNVRDTEVVDSTPFDNQKIEPIEPEKPKKQKAPITRGRARKDKGFQSPPPVKGKSLVSKSVDFAKKNPATAFLTFDAIRKYLPSRSPFGVVGGRAGTRSAAR